MNSDMKIFFRIENELSTKDQNCGMNMQEYCLNIHLSRTPTIKFYQKLSFGFEASGYFFKMFPLLNPGLEIPVSEHTY